MTKQEFTELFETALAAARARAEFRFGRKLPRSVLINLKSFGQDSKWIGIEQCVDFVYVDGHNFYRFIDLAANACSETHTGYFVRVSGHPPGSLAQTWEPEGLGPFKIMESDELKPLVL